MLSNAEFIVLNFPSGIEAGPLVPIQPPLEESIIGANATALQFSIHNAQYASWKFHTDQYNTQQSEVNQIKETLLGAFDPSTYPELDDPTTGTCDVTLAAIHAHLRPKHLSPTDLAKIKARLAVPYQTNIPIKHYTTSHLRMHNTCIIH